MLKFTKYKDAYIKAIDYNDFIHEKVYCPYCTKDFDADLKNHMKQVDNTKSYNRNKEYKEVFRDAVNTVVQMKELIEENPLEKLMKLKFKCKCGSKDLEINDILKTVDMLNGKISGEYRFVLFKVQNMKLSGGKLYINSYNTDGIKFTVALEYLSKENTLNIKKDDYIIAYGRLNYACKYNRFYLNPISDLSIEKIKRESVESLFEGKILEEVKMNRKSIGLKEKLNVKDELDVAKENKKEEVIKEERIPDNAHTEVHNGTNVKYIVRRHIERSDDNKRNYIAIGINSKAVQKQPHSQKTYERPSKECVKRIVKNFINKLARTFNKKSITMRIVNFFIAKGRS